MSNTSVRRWVTLQRIPLVSLGGYVIALCAWVIVIAGWLPMPSSGVGMQMSDPGVPESMALSNGLQGVVLYLLMWGVMMVAMMYPSSVPLFRLYTKTLAGTTKRAKTARVAAFVGTYSLVWTLTGSIALLVNSIVPIHAIARTNGTLLFGGTLVLLAVYQLSPYKHRCLQYCRTPLGFLMEYHEPGVRGAAMMSARFSMFCVGCCWALFAVMIVIGSMNILWMAAITVVLSLERMVPWGDRLARGVGVAAAVSGGTLVLLSGF